MSSLVHTKAILQHKSVCYLVTCLLFFTSAFSLNAAELLSQDQRVSYIGKLVAGGKTCTATLIGPKQIITSAHCLFDKTSNNFIHPHKVKFLAGYQQSHVLANSYAQSYTLGYKDFGKKEYSDQVLRGDWAIITLQQNIGCQVGYAELSQQNKLANNSPLTLVGYTKQQTKQQSNFSTCKFALAFDPNRSIRLKDCPLSHGLSGAAIFGPPPAKIIGIVSAGANDSKGRFRVVAAPVSHLDKHLDKTTCDKPENDK